MELDKRIKEGKRPLTCFDLKEASDFVNKTGYFTNELDYFSDLSETGCFSEVKHGRLLGIKDNKRCAFKYLSMDGSYENSYRFFLPEDWVLPEEPEKKFRPYTLAEWTDQHEIGEIIHFSYKDGRQEFNVMYTGYVIEHGEDIQDIRTTGRIMLLGTAYFLEDLFENYVICIDGEWQPFGVIEDD